MRQDALLACTMAAVALVVSALDGWSRGRPVPINDVGAVAGWAVPILMACAPLAIRRRYPLAAVAVSAAVVLAVAMASERDAGTWVLGLVVASAAYHRHRMRVLLLAGSIAWTVAFGAEAGAPGAEVMVVYAAAGAAPVALGYALRLRAERAVQAVRLQHAREEHARSQEAARIARDVHDIVGHHLSAIRLQAVGARRALGGRDTEADRALSGIADLSGEALAEIRALLARLVRTDTEETHERGLADLPALAERSGGPELKVALHVEAGLEGIVDPRVEACVYRVVQESLTNVTRHSGAQRASVRIRSAPGGINVTVDDPGAGHEPYGTATLIDRASPGGRGLTGMRARVEGLGGRFRAGPRRAGGWRVSMDLPTRVDDDSPSSPPVDTATADSASWTVR
ncbi:Signal transduction histidine kinase [Sinosporangium album]|uniref:histidine kinase n=2 Tax=Sinosporangium album TaxID=504805 RepID=A0A1G7QYQ8_9ACTN|nr:Signal transduction histidine kinase [Sinosporangium album]